MPFTPLSILGMWLKGLLSIAIIAGGIYLLRQWYEDSHVREAVPVQATADDSARVRGDDGRVGAEGGAVVPRRRVFHFEPGFNRETAELAGGLTLLIWACAGQFLMRGVMLMFLKPGTDDPTSTRDGAVVHRIPRGDGSELHVEVYGPSDGPPIVLTHGWGVNSTEWYYVKKHLSDRFRLIVWDLAGLGLSKKPDNNDFSLEKMARDLDAVLGVADERPAVLMGHSIGGMTTLTFCRLFPEALRHRVSGLALVHTTYTNPVRTTRHAALYTALEKPVLVPLLYLTIGLWPLVWAMNWLSYLNGSAHRSTHKESFAGTETRGQLDFAARFTVHARPDVLARGMFGMLAYDASTVLGTIEVPTLIVDGDLDNTTPPEASEHMNRDIPHSTLVPLSPARHLGLIERHESFDKSVAKFVESCQLARNPA